MNEDGSFAGRVAFVTGAASGIGRATALTFARAGADVIVADLAEEANQETASLIEQTGGRALAVRCDVTRSQDVQAALQKAVDTFGRLDFAFNNAGVEQEIKPAAKTRRQILELLVAGEQPVGALVSALQGLAPISQPAVSQHLKVLREAGLVNVRADGARRLYAIDKVGLGTAQDWLVALADPLGPFAQPLDALATELARGRRARRIAPAEKAAHRASGVA